MEIYLIKGAHRKTMVPINKIVRHGHIIILNSDTNTYWLFQTIMKETSKDTLDY